MTRMVMVTTEDNPYDYFTQFDEWYTFDTTYGYNTCSYLDRVSSLASSIDDENDDSLEQAIDEIVAFNLTGNYKKIVKEIED